MTMAHYALRGTEPPASMYQELTDAGLGSYVGGFVDRWCWNESMFHTLTQRQAEGLFNRIIACNKEASRRRTIDWRKGRTESGGEI